MISILSQNCQYQSYFGVLQFVTIPFQFMLYFLSRLYASSVHLFYWLMLQLRSGSSTILWGIPLQQNDALWGSVGYGYWCLYWYWCWYWCWCWYRCWWLLKVQTFPTGAIHTQLHAAHIELMFLGLLFDRNLNHYYWHYHIPAFTAYMSYRHLFLRYDTF